MASGKKNYFRHSFFARNDIKLRLLRDQVGVGFYFYYFSLLEQCGEAASDSFVEKFVFHNSIIRNLWSVNLKKSEHVASVMNAVGLLEFKKVDSSFEFTIPNLAKYLGKYETKFPSNVSNKRKENEIKENKIKEKETVLKVSPLSFLFDKWPDVQEWLNDGSHETHSLLVSKFSHHVLAEEVPKLFEWARKKEVRAESWMHTKLLNVETTVYGANKPKEAFKSRGHGVASTPQNPTGNPYIQEAIEKGYIA